MQLNFRLYDLYEEFSAVSAAPYQRWDFGLWEQVGTGPGLYALTSAGRTGCPAGGAFRSIITDYHMYTSVLAQTTKMYN